MKTLILTTALSILYAPAYACGNGECDPHTDEPGIETPDKPTEPDPQPEPEKPAPEKPQPEAPAPEKPQPETPAARDPMDGPDRKSSCDGWFYAKRHPEECDRPRGIVAGSLEVTDQTYRATEKWAPADRLPKVCERTWFTLRFSIPAGMTKAAARQRCVEWLEGE